MLLAIKRVPSPVANCVTQCGMGVGWKGGRGGGVGELGGREETSIISGEGDGEGGRGNHRGKGKEDGMNGNTPETAKMGFVVFVPRIGTVGREGMNQKKKWCGVEWRCDTHVSGTEHDGSEERLSEQ